MSLTVLQNRSEQSTGLVRAGFAADPSSYFIRISQYREQHKLYNWNFLFFYDHPVVRHPWFIAFNTVSIIHDSMTINVLNESDTEEIRPPSIRYFDQWFACSVRYPDSHWMSGSILYNFTDRGHDEIWLEKLLPINFGAAIGSSAQVMFEATLATNGKTYQYHHSRKLNIG